jgi:hypothetical protein
MNAERLMLLGGVSAFVLTLYWVRSRQLRERYAIGWMVLATILLLCGIFPNLIMRFADAARLSYSSAVLFIALGAMYLFSFFVTVSLSRQHRQSARLLQEIGLLQSRLEKLESRLEDRAEEVDRENGQAHNGQRVRAISAVPEVNPRIPR